VVVINRSLALTLRCFQDVRLNLDGAVGKTESFAYTEVDRTATFGVDLRGDAWRRRLDKIGAAFGLNAISGDDRVYLALGGQGFFLGDGALNYRREKISKDTIRFICGETCLPEPICSTLPIRVTIVTAALSPCHHCACTLIFELVKISYFGLTGCPAPH
jgi:hypothetical protein